MRRCLAVLLTGVLGIAGLALTGLPASAAPLSTRQAQLNLAALGYLRYDQVTGARNPATVNAAKKFQKHRCLAADGVIGQVTSDRLIDLTKQVQRAAGTVVDGRVGPVTRTAITKYQRSRGLYVDGVAGPVTLAAMKIQRVRNCQGNLIVGDIMADSTKVACGPGTRDVGIHNAYFQGRPIKTRLCAIPGFRSSSLSSSPKSRFYIPNSNGEVIVSSRISRAVLAMYRAGLEDGLTLRATSSFRSKEHQEAMCPCDGANVAPPGYSPHQSGVAIDFANAGGTGGATCATRARGTTFTYRWLDANARSYGFFQYAFEAWHWDPLRFNNRC